MAEPSLEINRVANGWIIQPPSWDRKLVSQSEMRVATKVSDLLAIIGEWASAQAKE